MPNPNFLPLQLMGLLHERAQHEQSQSPIHEDTEIDHETRRTLADVAIGEATRNNTTPPNPGQS